MRRQGELTRAVYVGCFLLCGAVFGAQSREPIQQSELAAEFGRAERALTAGQYGEAERLYGDLAKRAPQVAEVHAKLGVTYFQQGKYADAIPVLRRARSLKPGLPNLGALLAMSQSELGQHAEALPGLDAAFSRTTDRPLTRLVGLHLLRTYTALGRDADAVAVALTLSRRFENDPEVLYHSGRLFANFAYLQTMKLQKVASGSVWLHLAAGEANESQDLLDLAVVEYEQVLAMAPGRPGMHYRIGRVRLAQAKKAGSETLIAQAREQFELELRRDPSNANAAYELGELQRRAGEFDQAALSFGAAVSADAGFAEAFVGLGRTLIDLGRPADAIAPLTRATSLEPDDQVAVYQLAQAHQRIGNTAEQRLALEQFERLRANRREGGPLGTGRLDVTKQELPEGVH